MTRELRCGDIVGGCPAVFEGKDDDEVMAIGTVHAEEVHGFKNAPPEIIQQVRSLIHDKE